MKNSQYQAFAKLKENFYLEVSEEYTFSKSQNFS